MRSRRQPRRRAHSSWSERETIESRKRRPSRSHPLAQGEKIGMARLVSISPWGSNGDCWFIEGPARGKRPFAACESRNDGSALPEKCTGKYVGGDESA